MQGPPPLSDRCLSLLDKLARSAEHDLDSLAIELATLRREESRLLSRLRALEQQLQGASARRAALHAAGTGIDVEAIERHRGWVAQIEETRQGINHEVESVRRLIGPVLERMQSLQKRMRVLRRAHERRSARLIFGMSLRQQQEADEQQLARRVAWVGA